MTPPLWTPRQEVVYPPSRIYGFMAIFVDCNLAMTRDRALNCQTDEFRGWRLSAAANNKNIDAVRCMTDIDRHVTYHEIRASLDIGMSQIQSILHKHLGTKKLCSRWIPHNLAKD
ncbi:hypothetical protein EVAR_93691_1 [Eumeta japonica]|uniref:Histone-lysine N-methyltransferase SETMAR n=1 Tax=Eumeta variegata TaxID=151549 RepID=A0A4C1U393_EUMVA|nr:hypothetical protein EVAR_93691_1 [Eumeta japonica]